MARLGKWLVPIGTTPRWAVRLPASLFSEWALSNPSAWAYLAPIVIENDGWALFITTARGRNHAKSLLDMAQTREDWFSEVLPVNVTGAMSEEAVEQQRVEYTGILAVWVGPSSPAIPAAVGRRGRKPGRPCKKPWRNSNHGASP